METTDSSPLESANDHSREAAEQLSALLGSYKAEWLQEQMYELFAAPSYLPELTTARPCMLVGGRGTGKTTVLRCLSYQGQFAIGGKNAAAVRGWPFYGFYLRIDTSRIAAFDGPALQPHAWQVYFAHYVNLELCDLVLNFLSWYATQSPEDPALSPSACEEIGRSLNLVGTNTTDALRAALRDARVRFGAALNNVADSPRYDKLTLQGAPLQVLFENIKQLPQFSGKLFFFLIDEYENLLDYQQQIYNTLIKHCGDFYTFKIGVKELGHRVRTVLNDQHPLVSPADYVLVPISERLEHRFSDFASEVCNDRLRTIVVVGQSPIRDVRTLLPGMSDEDEADLLGVGERNDEARESLLGVLDEAELAAFDKLPPLRAYFLASWAEGRNVPLVSTLREYWLGVADWDTRYNNYKHSLLFTIRRRKGGVRKYYAGWDAYVHLAAGNIRYLLELVEQSVLLELRSGAKLGEPLSPRIQTLAAQAVGRKNVTELDGLSVNGAKLTRLVLGLGRVFQVMAAQPIGHTPEANQFDLSGGRAEPSDSALAERVDSLLREAVTHLALLRSPGNKLQSQADTREFDYMMHPIYSAFFEFSYRRKRKISLMPSDVLGLVETPHRTIGSILGRQNRSAEDELPSQLRLFEGFYASH